MMRLFAIFALTSFCAFADYSFLDVFETTPQDIPIEMSSETGQRGERATTDLKTYYKDFAEDGEVSIYLSFGKDAYHRNRYRDVFSMIRQLAYSKGLSVTNWRFTGSQISFRDYRKKINYRIDLGWERNAYQKAYANYDIVMYHGHSRYGRGPAFGTYTNYYRMGWWPNIEVDAQNRYFTQEPILQQDKYPVKQFSWGGKSYDYQYVGAKRKSSKLSDNAYVKRIEGMAKDLNATTFSKEKQIFVYYSCTNANYWKKPFRKIHPDTDKKFIFGTISNSYWSSKPSAVFITSVVEQVTNPTVITDRLDAVRDCVDDACWTTY